VNISHLGKSISIVPEKIQEVDYFLQHTDREPCFIDNEGQYVAYLGNPLIPTLLTDNRELLEQKIRAEFPQLEISETATLQDLKNLFADELENRKEQILTEQVAAIKDYRLFEDISTTFDQIVDNSLYDTPLMLEWKLTPRIRSRKWMFSADNLTDIPAESDPFIQDFYLKRAARRKHFGAS
jgi:hypothetical protein